MQEMVKENFVLTTKLTDNQLDYFIEKIKTYGRKSIFLRIFKLMIEFKSKDNDITQNKKKILLLFLEKGLINLSENHVEKQDKEYKDIEFPPD